ncbi:benzoate/H(+) symporter BenE family transporter [Endozoicomonas acroporae]|uniref:benzoate/H(+) symporter BenE family transporter n=1 Tax=Endozoicomonas acroporae TaxID=1701104 RepID=UPI003D7B1C26
MNNLVSAVFTNTFRLKDFSVPALVAGVIAIIVGYAGPTVLVFQVAQSAGLTDAQVTSWLWAYSIASGVTSILASALTRQPLIMAWSTPGIAFLVLGLQGVPFNEAIGAFIVSNILILIVGITGIFRRIIDSVPMSVAAALNAGILLPFALNAIGSINTAPEIAIPMIVLFFIVRLFSQRWAVAAVFLLGIALCVYQGSMDTDTLKLQLAEPVFTYPEFGLEAIINISIPLTVLALTGQYLPGLSAMRSFGFKTNSDLVVKISSVASIIAAPFCCHNINPSSMIAGIVAGPDAHEDLDRRYWAAIVAGIVYIIFGTLAGTFVLLFSSLPIEAVHVLAGVSLLAAIAGSLKTAIHEDKSDCVVPIVVFSIAISDLTIFSIGPAFWAILIGLVLYYPIRKKA